MNGLIFDDATCEFMPPPIVSVPRHRDYLWIGDGALPPRITASVIQHAVCDHYGLRLADMVSTSRKVVVSHPRQLAMYLCRELTARSYPEIGRAFTRDHSTVIHAHDIVTARLATSAKLRTDHAAILEVLGE